MSGPSNPRARRSPAPSLLLALDPAAARPLHRQVYDGLRDAILTGRLAPGARVPATRVLARDLDVARNTVAIAYEQLRLEGYLLGARGGGTRVRHDLPDGLLRPAIPRETVRQARTAAGAPTGDGPEIDVPGPRPESPASPPVSARTRSLLASGFAGVTRSLDATPVPFRLGVPALAEFPTRIWARLTARAWRHGRVPLGEGNPLGEPALRAAIAAYVTEARAVRCEPAQVVVVSGTQQALDVVARSLINPGDAAWVENPGYPGTARVLAAVGARIVPVPVDRDGLRVDVGEALAPDARLVCVTPSHQFPLGGVLSVTRRLALLDWARRAGAWIVEDDYDSEFRYAGRPLPSLQGLEQERATRLPAAAPRVLYTGTFNKTLAPGLRLGYLVVPDALVDAVCAWRRVTDRYPPALPQVVLADFIAEGHYAQHLRRLRLRYAERRAALHVAVLRDLAGVVALEPDDAGLHAVGWLSCDGAEQAVASAARRAGVEVAMLSTFRRPVTPETPGPRDAVLLGYAAFEPPEIEQAVARLAARLDRPVLG